MMEYPWCVQFPYIVLYPLLSWIGLLYYFLRQLVGFVVNCSLTIIVVWLRPLIVTLL